MRKYGNAKTVLEYLYLIYLGIIVFFAVMATTTIEHNWISNELILAEQIIGITLISIKLFADNDEKYIGEILLVALLVASFTGSYRIWQRRYVLEFLLLIVGARSVDEKKILKVYCCVAGGLVLVAMGLALGGKIEHLIYDTDKNGIPEYAFGICYTSDFTAHVLYIEAAYAWIRGKKITIGEIFIIGLSGLFCWHFCATRTNFICLEMLAFGLLYFKIRRGISTRSGKNYHPVKWFQSIVTGGSMCIPFIMIGLTFLYDQNNRILQWINNVLTRRLFWGKQAVETYSLNLFGQHVPMQGLGWSTELHEDYFFLDCSYVNNLYRLGLLVLLCGLIMLFILLLYTRKNGFWEQMLIVIIIILQCSIEHHLMEIAYNPFFLLIWQFWQANTEKHVERLTVS